MERKHRTRYQRRLLLDEIGNKHKHLKQLNKQLHYEANKLKLLTVSISWWILIKVRLKQQLIYEKAKRRRSERNTIWNLTARVLSNEEYQVLCYGLNHGWAACQKTKRNSSVESVCDQIDKKNICKETQNYIEIAKNLRRALAFSLIDLDNCQVFRDKKKLEIIKNLREKLVILKPDKGNEVVLVRTIDYYSAVENLFLDKSKFKIHDDPTPARLSSLQRYLKTLNNRNQLNDEVFKKIRPQNAKLVERMEYLKFTKHLTVFLLFAPIIDTTRATHYSVGNISRNFWTLSHRTCTQRKILLMQLTKLAKFYLMFITLMNTCLSR